MGMVEEVEQSRKTGLRLAMTCSSFHLGLLRLGPDLVFEFIQTFLADVPPPALEAVAKEAEAPALVP